ncbi:ABC-2 type transport system permease protein [Clostridiales Family XIII bacterium PM5-7]
MFIELVKIMLKSIFSGMISRNKKKSGKGKIVLMGLLAIYIVGVFGIMFFGIFATICDPFVSMGMGWLVFGIMGLMVFLLCFIGSVFMTQNQLYEAKDNNLLLSMPVPVKYILASRMVALAALNYVYELLIVGPGAVAYGMVIGFTPMQVIIFVIAFALLPLLVLAASALFGWVIALANSKMRNKNVITMIFTLGLFLFYMYVCMQANNYLKMLIENGEAIGNAVRKAMPPFYYLGEAIFDSNFISLGIYVLFCLIPFGIVYYILSRSFIKIATSNKGHRRIAYKEKGLKTSGILQTLIGKELSHFIGSPMYMFNAGIGLVFMPIAAGYLFIKKDALMENLSMLGLDSSFLGAAVCIGFGTMASLTIISAPTISIEAKTLWISQSMPIRPRDAIMAKAHIHTICSLPFIIVSAVLIELSLTDISLISRVLIVIFPIAVTVFNAFTGVFLGLKYPKFDWINEITAVKQGAAPMLSMLIAMATIAIPSILYVWKLQGMIEPDNYMAIVCGIFILAALALYRYLTTKGEYIFSTLQN